MTDMLHPLTCTLVMIDTSASSLDITSLIPAMEMMAEAAGILTVPVVTAGYLTTTQTGVIASIRSGQNSGPVLSFDPAVTPWPSTPIGQGIAATGRNQLIVSGVWLEEAITFLALTSLSVGLDTYVAIDAIAAFNPDHSYAAHARLTQAGAVPTSSAQIVREWAALTDDVHNRSTLLALANRHSRNSP
jgi:Isochorismatase family